jgi:threonine dehydrogenase-like Zn-dependent dehydrogenase
MQIKALQCSGPNKLELTKFQKPEPENDSILLRVKTCGICGTDVHGVEGKRTLKYPFIPGHEIVATIDSFGKDADKFIKYINGAEIKAGDRVTVNPRIVCGKCYYCVNFPMDQEMCINSKTATSIGSCDYPHLFGGWAEYMYLLPGSEIIKLPDDLSDENATLIEPYTCAVGCIDRYKNILNRKAGDAFEISDTIVIYGAGAIGMLMVAGFNLAGAKNIVVVDAIKEKLDLAQEFGASHTINVLNTNASERIKIIKELTQDLGAGVVIEACGVPEMINEGISSLKRKGILFEIGHLLDAGDAKINPYTLCRNEIQLLGHYAYPSSQSMAYAANLLAKNELPYEKLLKFFRMDQYKEVIFDKKTQNAIKPAFLIG